MSDILDRIKEQGKRDQVRQVAVPEWGDAEGPLVIYYCPPTLSDVGKAAAVTAEVKGNAVRQNVELFVLLACGADGHRMFKRIDVLALMDVADPDVLGRVMMEMGIVRAPVKDAVAEKN